MISFYSCYTVRSIIIINIIGIAVVVIIIIYYCYRIIVISCPHYTCVVWLVSITQLVQLAVLSGWHYQNKSKFFFLWQQHYSHPTPIPSPPPLHTEIVVQFYPWSKFYFLLFQTHYHTLPYPKTYLPWQQPTLVVDSGDSLFLTSPLSPTVNSPNNPTTGRRNKSSKQDPRVALCCSLVFI